MSVLSRSTVLGLSCSTVALGGAWLAVGCLSDWPLSPYELLLGNVAARLGIWDKGLRLNLRSGRDETGRGQGEECAEELHLIVA